MGLRKIEKKFTVNADKATDLVAFKGKGAMLTDLLGDKFVDLCAGKFTPFGYHCKKWERKVKSQIKKFSSENFYSRPVAEFSKALCRRTKMKRVFLTASADAANESAFLAARKYSFDKYGADRYKIAVTGGAFHGYSFTALSAADVLAQGFGPKAEGFICLPENDIVALEQSLDETVCALAITPLQTGSFRAIGKEYLEKAIALCKDKDILLIVDETNIPLGAAGQLFSYMNYGVSPDIVTAAQGFGGPLGVTIFNEKAENALSLTLYGAQQGGNPAVCAGALALLNAVNEKQLAVVREKGKRMREVLAECENIRSFEGAGMLVGFAAESAETTAQNCLSRNLIVGISSDHILLCPPIDIDEDLLEKSLRILADVLT